MNSLFQGDFVETKRDAYYIDIMYGQKDWTMVSALRELLSNMIDTKTNYTFFYDNENKYGVIEDEGTGLPLRAFVFGGSSKANDVSSIGQYGEGLKMALLTSLRYGNKVSIQTMNYGVEIDTMYSNEYESNLMVIIYNNNSRKLGTSIRIECTKEEWNDAIDLFLQFKEGYQKLDKGLYLPSGFISILGVKTEENSNLRFSYDLDDKTLTNRDRNVIKIKEFKRSMEKILNNLKNQKSIKNYIDGFEESPECDEYKLELNPKHKDIWISTIQKIYGDKYAYSTTIESDIKAISKGYKIIRSFTKGTQKTMANLGIPSSKDVSKGMRTNDVVVVEENKMIYPISRDYVKNWNWLDAGREFLANAIDSCIDDNATIVYEDGYCIIKDNGKGIEKKNFVIGNSNKDTSDIGMFGEGLKLAMLVMAREDRNLVIETVGNTYTPKLENNTTYCSEIFTIYYEQNNILNSTTVRFKATKEEVDSIKNLFIGYKENVEIKNFGIVEVISNECGNIYVNGLKTKSINSNYSYNIKDKTLVNSRDRNSVDEMKLEMVLSNFYNSIDDEEIIENFLTSWKKDKFAYEYKLVVVPKNIKQWEKIISKTFKNVCISDAYDMESNFIAKQAGYELLIEIPAYVKDILSRIVSSSIDIAREYDKKGILFGNRILYPISIDYANNWDSVDAIVEFISNALDTNTNVLLDCNGGKIIVEDCGQGFEKKNLLFGSSESAKVGKAIGTFGEGLKMACLVLARETNKEVKIETVGFNAIAKIVEDKEYNSNVLVLNLEENNRECGTKITFVGTKDLLEKAKSKILVYNTSFEKVNPEYEIYTPGGSLFINGVKICSINSLYSYNFVGHLGKSLLNRDRKTVDTNMLSIRIPSCLGEVNDEKIMKSILSMKNGSYLENYLGSNVYCIDGRKKKRWKKVALEVFEKCCLPNDNAEINLVAKDCGYKVLVNILTSISNILSYIGFPTSKEVVNLRGDEDEVRRVIDKKQLTSEEKEVWERIEKILVVEYGETILSKIEICEEFVNSSEETQTLGLYSPKHNKCYVLRSLVCKNRFAELLGVIAHEIIHMETGYHDRTRDFENALTNLIGVCLEKIYA